MIYAIANPWGYERQFSISAMLKMETTTFNNLI